MILPIGFFIFVALHVIAVIGLMLAQWKDKKILQRIIGIFWLLLLITSVLWAWGDPGKPNGGEALATQNAYFRCLYYGFPDGEVLPDNGTSGGRGNIARSSVTMFEDAPGCMGDFDDLIKRRSPHVVVFIGRSDRNELSPHKLQKYGSNEALAYQRAKSVKERTAKEWTGQSILIAAGPAYADGVRDSRLLERDRSVEVRAYWEPRPEEGNLGAGTLFNVDHELVLLGVIIALSTYLAAVSVFLRQQIGERKGDQRSYDRPRKSLRLLVLADLPLILSGVLLFVHIYYSVRSLQASLQSLAMAVTTLLLFHGYQWWISAKSWWKIDGAQSGEPGDCTERSGREEL
jgi:hypothetical protein